MRARRLGSDQRDQWLADSLHDSIITVGNGGIERARAQLTFYYHGGQDKYQVEQTLAPDDQMWLDLGKLIRDQVPGKDGKTIPPEVTSGVYQIEDLSHVILGPLYEAKLIVDKTNGHAFYGCYLCCGADGLAMGTDPMNLAISDTQGQTVWSVNKCGGNYLDLTDAMTSWGTDDTSIATASAAQVHGVGTGSTDNFASGMVSESGKKQCPQNVLPSRGPTNVAPVITSIDPPIAMIGSTAVQITINGAGFGGSPTVNLPSGITSTGQGSQDTKIVVTVNIAFTATVGNNDITVTASSLTSNPATFQVNGPYHMIVEGDITDKCPGCSTTVRRRVTYQIQNFDGTNAGATWMGEDFNDGSSSCTPNTQPGTAPCSANFQTLSSGVFTDGWSMNSDSYTPAGCGVTVNYDHWQWCQHNPPQTLGTLTGYIHTDKISINGVVSPNAMTKGTVVPF